MIRKIPLVLCLLTVCGLPGVSAPLIGSYGGWEAVWSKDGRQIAFTSGLPHASSNIWIVNSDGSGARQLTTHGGYEPTWTPDGSEVTFLSDRGQGPRYYRISVSTAGQEKPFDQIPVGAAMAVWSPDGKRIAYAVPQGDTNKLFVADLATGENKELRFDLVAREYRWSPDGKKLAIVTGEIVGNSLMLYDVASGKIENMYHGYCSSPSFSPDGTMLAFGAPLGSNRHRLFIVLPQDKTDRRIGVTDFDGKSISWTPDSRGLLYASSTKNKPAQIWTINSQGRGMVPFKMSYEWVGNPAYSPSGDYILYEAVTKDSYSNDLYVCRADGIGSRRLTSTTVSYWQPQWLAPGKLAVMTDEGRRGQVLVVDSTKSSKRLLGPFDLKRNAKIRVSPAGDLVAVVQGGEVRTLSVTGKKPAKKPFINSPYPTNLSWTPDGKTIFYADARRNGLGISAVGVDGKNKVYLTPPQINTPDPTKAQEHSNALAPAISREVSVPGGGEISAPAAASADTGAAQAPPPVIDNYPAVSPDGKAVLFVRGSELRLIDMNGQNDRLLVTTNADADYGVTYPSWSKDGSEILFELRRKSKSGLAYELWTAKRDGSDVKRVYERQLDSEFDLYSDGLTNPAAFTPDGKSVLFTLAASGTPNIWLLDLASGQAKQLTQTGATFPCLSNDAKELAYVGLEGNRERIWVREMATGKSRMLKISP